MLVQEVLIHDTLCCALCALSATRIIGPKLIVTPSLHTDMLHSYTIFRHIFLVMKITFWLCHVCRSACLSALSTWCPFEFLLNMVQIWCYH